LNTHTKGSMFVFDKFKTGQHILCFV